VSDWIAPEAMFTEMAPPAATAAAGGELTVDSTLACALTAPARSTEPAMAMTHDRCNHMDRIRERRAGRAQAASVRAFASLLESEIRESQHELLRSRVVAPGYFETSVALGE